MRWTRRLAYWLHFRSQQEDLREELAFHHQQIADDFVRRGLSAEAANAAARRALGNDTYMREESRGVWLAPHVEALIQDWRYAWRGLRRSPAFSLVAVISLGLGIGANTAIFGIIHTMLLARLPIHAPEQLVQLRRSFGADGWDDRLSLDEYKALATGPVKLAMFGTSAATLQIGEGRELSGSLEAVDARYFDLMDIRAERGRLIAGSDEEAPIVVITDGFWRKRMNADAAAIGKTIKIDGHMMTVVGIAPRGFAGLRFPAIADMFVPFRVASDLGIIRVRNARTPMLTLVGRRASGQPIQATSAQLAAIWNRCCASQQLAALPSTQAAKRSALELMDVSRGIPQVKLDLRGRYTGILLALMAGVGILLLAACANVANLLLARSSARSGELAVRRALGASHTRLVTQLVIESIQLSLAGAAAGILLAHWGTTALTRMNVGDLSGMVSTGIGPAVLTFTIAVSLVSGIVFGAVPAMRVLRTDLITPLKQAGRRSAPGRRGILDRGLVALQMALALLLVSGGTLLVQTLRNLQGTDLGFAPAGRLAITVETRRTSYDAQGMTTQMADEMLRRVRAIPGVRSAGFGSLVPVYGGRSAADNVSVRGGTAVTDASTWFTAVTPGYFGSLGMSMQAGRDLGAARAGAGVREVVVNDDFAKKFFPNRNPIGQVFEDADDGDSTQTENRVIGVVASAKFADLRAPKSPMYFVPVADHDWPYLVLVVEPRGTATALGPALVHEIASVAPGISIGDPVLLSASIDNALSRERVSARLAILFGAVALCLVAVGLYGVMLYQVTERTTEIGIRMALGAQATTVLAMVMRQALAVVGVGLVLGVPLSILGGRAVASQLYGVAPYNIQALAVAAGSLILVAIAASFIPARRAIGVDPLTALRAE